MSPARSGRARARSRERVAIVVGLLISAVIHVAILLLYPGVMDRLPDFRTTTSPTDSDLSSDGIQIISIRIEEEEVESADDEVVQDVIVDLPEPIVQDSPEETFTLPPLIPPTRPGDADVVAPPAERDDRQRTAAERLRPEMGDPRLWTSPDRSLVELTEAERAEIYLRAMIRSWDDSVAVAVALSEQATDWTFTDEQGRRWGLSPGRLHLGDFSIPLPLSFDIPAARRESAARVAWERRDILRGSATADVRRSWAERAREIRARMDADRERARARDDGN